MNGKIEISICCGTYCHIMGGAELQLIEDELPTDLKDKIELKYSTCLGNCKNETNKPPYVKIGGETLEKANLEIIENKLKEILKNKNHDSNQ